MENYVYLYFGIGMLISFISTAVNNNQLSPRSLAALVIFWFPLGIWGLVPLIRASKDEQN